MNTPDAQEPFKDPQAFGIYIHFPYCSSICSYCDFVVTATPQIPHHEYAAVILEEFHDRADRFDELELTSIYFGGGTPSLWDPKQVHRIIETICSRFGRNTVQEITLEANPSPELEANLDGFVKAGVNRISLGIQSLNNQILKELRRTHSAEEALSNLDQVAYVRFASVYKNFKEAKDFEQFIGNLNVYKSE